MTAWSAIAQELRRAPSDWFDLQDWIHGCASDAVWFALIPEGEEWPDSSLEAVSDLVECAERAAAIDGCRYLNSSKGHHGVYAYDLHTDHPRCAACPAEYHTDESGKGKWL